MLENKQLYDKLIDLFVKKNKQINLSAIRNPKDIWIKHILDSLEWNKIVKQLHLSQANVVDVWTGSGFPLLPLAIENPSYKFIGLESVRKKVNAVNDIISQLWLQNVEVVWTRAEDYKGKQFDLLTARAVAYITKLVPWTYHLVKPGGYLMLYKLKSDEEYQDLQKIIKKYKLTLVDQYQYKLFEDDIDRIIYLLKK